MNITFESGKITNINKGTQEAFTILDASTTNPIGKALIETYPEGERIRTQWYISANSINSGRPVQGSAINEEHAKEIIQEKFNQANRASKIFKNFKL